MTLVLLTIDLQTAQHDIAVPDDVPIRELIGPLVNVCTTQDQRRPTAQWAIGTPGLPPLPPTQTLNGCSVLDGTVIYLRDMVSPVPPPPPGPQPQAPDPMKPIQPLLDIDALLNKDEGHKATHFPRFLTIFISVWALVGDLGWGIKKDQLVIALPIAILILGMCTLCVIPNSVLYKMYLARKMTKVGKTTPLRSFTGPIHTGPRSLAPAPQSLQSGESEIVNSIVEQFMFDLGRLIAGQDPELQYCDPTIGQYLGQVISPVRARREWYTPQFGGDVEVSISQNPQRPTDPIVATVRVNDISIRHLSTGESIATPQRVVTITLVIDAPKQLLVDVRIISSSGVWP